VLQRKTKKPEKMSDDDWDVLDQKAATTIIFLLSNNVLFNVAMETTAKQI